MSIEDYAKGYRDGFKDGYEQGQMKSAYNPFHPQAIPQQWKPDKDSCHVCGIKWKDSTHYCCMRMDCPSKTIFTATTIVDPGPDDVGC